MRLVGRCGLSAAFGKSEATTRSWQRAGRFKAALVVDGRELFDLDDSAISSLISQQGKPPEHRMDGEAA